MPVRRVDVTDTKEINDFLGKCYCMRLGIQDDDGVYVVPVHFFYEADENGKYTFYFHGSPRGKKTDLLKQTAEAGKKVGFEMDEGYQMYTPKNPDMACDYSALVTSAIGQGKLEFITEPEDKKKVFIKMAKQVITDDPKRQWKFSPSELKMVMMGKINVTDFTVASYKNMPR